MLVAMMGRARPGGTSTDPAAGPALGRGISVEEAYRALDLQPGATLDQVREAYHDLAKIWHPDRFVGDERLQVKAQEQMRAINEAYNRLKVLAPAPATTLATVPPARPKADRPPGKARVPLAIKPGAEVEVDDSRSPWEIHGWAWSILAHAVVLVVLGVWYLNGRSSKVPTFDTRLAGSEDGVPEGMTNLGGLDTPVPMPEVAPEAPRPEASFSRMKSDVPINPLAGSPGNPGAGLGDGFGLAKFGGGGENVRGVAVKVGDPQFTLLWTSKADIDLHVIEPGGKEIFWNDTKGRFGGELDVDNVEGFGPENIYWLKQAPDGSKDLGPGPPGDYKWFVRYYGGNGGVPVRSPWRVRIKHEGRVEILQGVLSVPGSQSKTYTLTVGEPPKTAADQ